MDGQTDRYIKRTDIQRYGPTDCLKQTEIDGQMDGQTDKRTDELECTEIDQRLV